MTALLADLVLAVHLLFVLFVVGGGLLVLRWPRVAWAHLPAAAWGAWVEFAGWICPLTPREDRLRLAGGERPGGGDFVERVLLPVLYPGWLTRETQVALGAAAVVLNLAVYAWVIARRRRRRDGTSTGW
jgi:hypothetical protein